MSAHAANPADTGYGSIWEPNIYSLRSPQRAFGAGILKRKRARRPTRISQDRELQSFIESCFTRRLTYSEIHAECLAVYGKQRTPSRDAIGRYFREGIRADA